MKRTLLLIVLIISVLSSGCQLIPGKSSKDKTIKKNIFGYHSKNDPNFGEKVAKDPFPSASSVGLNQSQLD